MTPNRPNRWRRRLVKVVATLFVLILGTVACIPSLLSTAPAKRWVVARLNRSLGKGQVEIDSISASWRGPIVVRGLQVKGRQGKPILVAPRTTIDRGLWHLLTDRRHLGSIFVEGPTLDLERREDGSLNLAEALGLGSEQGTTTQPAVAEARPDPAPDVTVSVVNGSLKFRSPELGEPFSADRLDATVRLPGDGSALTWTVAIVSQSGDSLDAVGSFDRSSTPPRASVDLIARRWPAHLVGGGVALKGRLDGKIGVRRAGDTLDLSGDARLLDVDLTGPALAGDRVVMAAFGGKWDVTRGGSGWSIRSLDVAGPIASLRSDAPIPAGSGHPATVSARVDLAAVAKQAPRALRLRDGLTLTKGTADLRLVVREDRGTQRIDALAKLSDLIATGPSRPSPIVLNQPATLSSKLSSRGEGARVDSIRLETGWLTADGSGDVTSGVKFDATVDLAGMRRQLGDLIDFGAIELGGSGSLTGDYRREPSGFVARVTGDVKALTIAGLSAEPIRRDRAILSADARGSADVSGVPLGWSSARIALTDGTDSLSTTLAPRPSGLDAAIMMSVAASTGRIKADLDASWSNAIADVRSARINWKTTDPATSIAISMMGRIDTKAGSIVLAPLPTSEPSTIAIAPKGLRILGLIGPEITVEGDLSGDYASIDRALAAFSAGTPLGIAGAGGMTLKARYEKAADRLTIAEVVVGSPSGWAGLKGGVSDFSGSRRADVTIWPTIAPETIDAFVTSHLADDAKLIARAKSIHVVGPLSADRWKELVVDAALDIDRADAYGLHLGPSPIAAHLSRGKIQIDPIVSTLNGGRVELRPVVTFEDAGGMTLRLLDGSAVADAAIDDEFSRRLLSYAAPLLRDATEVRGHLSASLAHAEFPIGGDGSRSMGLEGRVEFKDLRFGPGTMAREVLDLAAGAKEPEVRINEAISVAVINGRVYQKGLAVNLGKGRRIGLEGSVGFDTSLALRALIPLASFPGLKGDAGATHLPVAIGGTFARPTIDRRALARAMKSEGGKALRREAEGQARELLKRLGPIGDGEPKRRR